MSNEQTVVDPVVDEIHAVRRQLLQACGGDVAELVRQVRSRELTSGRVLIYPRVKASAESADPNRRATIVS